MVLVKLIKEVKSEKSLSSLLDKRGESQWTT